MVSEIYNFSTILPIPFSEYDDYLAMREELEEEIFGYDAKRRGVANILYTIPYCYNCNSIRISNTTCSCNRSPEMIDQYQSLNLGKDYSKLLISFALLILSLPIFLGGVLAIIPLLLILSVPVIYGGLNQFRQFIFSGKYWFYIDQSQRQLHFRLQHRTYAFLLSDIMGIFLVPNRVSPEGFGIMTKEGIKLFTQAFIKPGSVLPNSDLQEKFIPVFLNIATGSKGRALIYYNTVLDRETRDSPSSSTLYRNKKINSPEEIENFTSLYSVTLDVFNHPLGNILHSFKYNSVMKKIVILLLVTPSAILTTIYYFDFIPFSIEGEWLILAVIPFGSLEYLYYKILMYVRTTWNLYFDGSELKFGIYSPKPILPENEKSMIKNLFEQTFTFEGDKLVIGSNIGQSYYIPNNYGTQLQEWFQQYFQY